MMLSAPAFVFHTVLQEVPSQEAKQMPEKATAYQGMLCVCLFSRLGSSLWII
jgi:hypothetical protein